MYTKVKGTQDFFGDRYKKLKYIEHVFERVCSRYNFTFLETPTFEQSELFLKSAGELSDLFSKEIYVFKDRSDRQLALRPEGTAPVVRAYIENKLHSLIQYQKLAYFSKMYRYERPQAGRYREFYQAGVEYFAKDVSPLQDFEIIEMAAQFLNSIGISDYKLCINFLGTPSEVTQYTESLREYLLSFKSVLTPMSIARLEGDRILRILDDKVEREKPFFASLPKIIDFLSEESREYFRQLLEYLHKSGIDYSIDYTLVRGLDYYTGVVFEFVDTITANAQKTLIGGGRYRDMVKTFGGPNLAGIGFAAGVERLIDRIDLVKTSSELKIYIGRIQKKNRHLGFERLYNLAHKLRKDFIVEYDKHPRKINKIFETFFAIDFDYLILEHEVEDTYELIDRKKVSMVLTYTGLFQYLEQKR